MGTKLAILEGASEILSRLGLDDPRRALEVDGGQRLKDSDRSRLIRFSAGDHGESSFFLKVYPPGRLRKFLVSPFRKSRAEVEFSGLRFLHERGFPTAEPLAFGEHRTLGFLRSSFVLTRGIEGVVNLDELCASRRGFASSSDARRVRAAALALARVVRRMHDLGFYDYDLHFRNILVDPARFDDATPAFHIIDFPKGRIQSGAGARSRERARRKDFETLERDAAPWCSQRCRLRFLAAYRRGRSEMDTRTSQVP